VSSSVHLNFDDGEEITLDHWNTFAAQHGLAYDPHVVGQNTYRRAGGGVEVWFGDDGFRPEPGADGRIDFTQCTPPAEARRIVFMTTWMSSSLRDVAKLAIAAWHEFGGALAADPEIRALIKARP